MWSFVIIGWMLGERSCLLFMMHRSLPESKTFQDRACYVSHSLCVHQLETLYGHLGAGVA